MRIDDHLLKIADGRPVPNRMSPNHGAHFVAGQPDTLVIHFTAGRSADSSVAWLSNPAAKASAHVVIAEDGTITQLVPFNVVAWHAGQSKWKDRESLNRFSLGIELANPGALNRTGSKWRTWYGDPVDDDLVLVAKHKHRDVEQGWKIYSAEQLEAAVQLGSLLVQTYGIREVVGHEDIAPGRKSDPGPAFPMERYRGLLLGRSTDDVA
jgi:N-acetylmuramoyl-L-alanine amidase